MLYNSVQVCHLNSSSKLLLISKIRMEPLSMSAEGIFFLNPAVKKKASRELLSKLLSYPPFLILLVITAAYVPYKQKVVFTIYYVY